MDFLRIIVAILLPPLGVFLQVGIGGAFWLNIVLTLFGYTGNCPRHLDNSQALSFC